MLVKEIQKNCSCCYLCLNTGYLSKYGTKNCIYRICKRNITVFVKKTPSDQTASTAVNLNHEKSSKNVLLQSAVFQIENIENSNYCTDGAVLFDTGSQRSFVTESVRKRLKLPTLIKATFGFQAFGQIDKKVKEVDIAQIKIKGKKGL